MINMSNDEITNIWEAMPGQPGGWLKEFGYIQFARAIEAEVAERYSAQAGITSLEGLTRYGWTEAYIGDTSELVEQADGTYVKFADVERLLATQAQAAAPAADERIRELWSLAIEQFQRHELGVSVHPSIHLVRAIEREAKATSAHPAAAVEPKKIERDGWMVDGSMIYRLNEAGWNRDEINVTMVNGSRDPGVRHDAAVELLAELTLDASQVEPAVEQAEPGKLGAPVPEDIITMIREYGDARADGNARGTSIANIILAIRRHYRSVPSASQAAPASPEQVQAAFFRRSSEFGPWIECSPNEAGAVRFLAVPIAAQVQADHHEAVTLLAAVFDAWENGAPCYEDADPSANYLGTAFRLDEEIFNRCCDLLNRLNPPKNAVPSAAAPAAPSEPTEIGEILRKASNNPGRTANDIDLLTRAANECDRFYGGMMNWKANAQAKDKQIADWREKALAAPAAPEQDEVKRLRNRVSQLEAARIGYANEFPLNADGEPDVGNIHANIRKLKAQVQTDAARDVLAERRRQVEVEGWTAERDDKYINCELARAAATYATCSHIEQVWPWHPDWWKRSTYRRDLVKAGALILAEIERLDRDSMKTATNEGEARDE